MLTSVAAHVGCLAVSAGSRDSGREKAQAENEEQSRHHYQNHCSLPLHWSVVKMLLMILCLPCITLISPSVTIDVMIIPRTLRILEGGN